MSARNGDRARFQKNRKRKLLLRQRSRKLTRSAGEPAKKAATPQATSGTSVNS